MDVLQLFRRITRTTESRPTRPNLMATLFGLGRRNTKSNDTDWSMLEDALGPADAIPSLIKSLESEDRKSRQTALEALEDRLIHQGAFVFEATPHAVPVMVKALENEDLLDRYAIVRMLIKIGHGVSVFEQFDQSDALQDAMKQQLNTPEMMEQRKRNDEWVQNAHRAVRGAVPAIEKLLLSSDRRLRSWATFFLGEFGVEDPRILAALMGIMRSDTNSHVRATGAFAVSRGTPAPVVAGEIKNALDKEGHPLTRLVMAMSLARLLKEYTPEEVEQSIVKALVEPEMVEEAYADLPWVQNKLHVDVIACLSILGEEALQRTLNALSASDKDTATASVKPLLNRLLMSVFYKRPKQTPEALTLRQKQTIMYLTSHKNLWSEHYESSLKDILKAFKLPTDRMELIQYVGMTPSA
ncbi:HEAT repeat domain-containing protein [Deinococcus cellulosilyticus]|nr:HEAT repeat domain-containing protein [Deinococcus cellulosilyticus]